MRFVGHKFVHGFQRHLGIHPAPSEAPDFIAAHSYGVDVDGCSWFGDFWSLEIVNMQTSTADPSPVCAPGSRQLPRSGIGLDDLVQNKREFEIH